MRDALAHRFGEPFKTPNDDLSVPSVWTQLAERGSCRHFREEKVEWNLLKTLCALSLSSPTKSDLQQRDILVVEDANVRSRINLLLTSGPFGQEWITGAPSLIVFCANNRRQRQLHEWRGKPFANDHLDPLFNASIDAGVALSAFVIVAEAAGLGCAPISIIRNHAQEVCDLLGLPDHVFPVAGLGLGWPARRPRVSLRLPLSATVHVDRFSEAGIKEKVDLYDRRRHEIQPMGAQRAVDTFGETEFYTWSEDKARQYAVSERADFGEFLTRRGFKLS